MSLLLRYTDYCVSFQMGQIIDFFSHKEFMLSDAASVSKCQDCAKNHIRQNNIWKKYMNSQCEVPN